MIDSECRQVNDKLRHLAAVLPDIASLSPLDYDCTSKRADVDVLQTLVEFAKKLKVKWPKKNLFFFSGLDEVRRGMYT